MRAVRFAARYGLRIEPETSLALRELASLVQDIAPERVEQELRIMLTGTDPALALRMMDELGILREILPELEEGKGCEQPENYHPEGDVFIHSILTVEKLGPRPDFALAMAALLHDVGKPEASRRSEPKRFPDHERIGRDMARAICRRFRLPRDETDRICWLVHRHMYFKDARRMKQSTLKRLFGEPGFEQLARLCRADALASWGNLDDYHYVLEKRRSIPPESIDPPPLINGRDLIERGYKPGPAFRRILDAVREMQLQGELSTRQGALGEAERLAREIDAPTR
jgi:poly(A) polymerase